MIRSYLPHCCVGPIVKGFGRGSKELGCPTGSVNDIQVIQYLNHSFRSFEQPISLWMWCKNCRRTLKPVSTLAGQKWTMAKFTKPCWASDGIHFTATIKNRWCVRSIERSMALLQLYFRRNALFTDRSKFFAYFTWTGNTHIARIRWWSVRENIEIMHLRLLATWRELRLIGCVDCGHSERHRRRKKASGWSAIQRSPQQCDIPVNDTKRKFNRSRKCKLDSIYLFSSAADAKCNYNRTSNETATDKRRRKINWNRFSISILRLSSNAVNHSTIMFRLYDGIVDLM